VSAPSDGPLSDDATREAVTAALAAEHAAIWAYGLVSAFLPATVGSDLAAAALVHRERRDALVGLLEAAGLPAPPAAAAYRTPAPVTDTPSAAALLVVAESDVAAAWRAVCERTEAVDGGALRTLGIDAMVAAATVGVRWRRLAGTEPVVPVFPGLPDP
jgi:hypothetical protein